jgi:hypothetical protein
MPPSCNTTCISIVPACFSAILKMNNPGSIKNNAQYRALLILLNEEGLVVNFCLTRGESLKEGEAILKQALRQSEDLQCIVTGMKSMN